MIKIDNLTKKYDNNTAVDAISLEIKKGEFFGLLGSNGAGKTTTIGMLSTLLLPTEGSIYIDGELLGRTRADIKRKISVITQEFSMRQDMDMDEIMEYQGRLYYMKRADIKKKTDELFEFCGLTAHRKKTVRKLSGGMKRKLMVCRALLTDPQVLLLDEPTVGMDAVSRHQMWDLLRKLNEKGITIILTTHYIDEAEALCSRVAMMDKGHINAVDTPEAFIARYGRYVVTELIEGKTVTHFFDRKEAAIKYAESAEAGFKLREATLEDVFVAMYL